MKKLACFALVMLFVLNATDADAQRRGARRSGFHFTPMAHKAEISGLYGYNWQSDYEVFVSTINTTGRFDVKSSDNWGVQLDVNTKPGVQAVLLYNRMTSKATFQPTRPTGRKVDLGDIAVEYYHVGAISGPLNGNVMPYGGLTLGATRFAAGGDDSWKFSFTPQIGAKLYANERLALRLHARLPITLLNSGFGFGFGTGGSYATVNGTGTIGFDLGGGISILLGS